MLLPLLGLLLFSGLYTARAACRSTRSVVTVCRNNSEVGDSVYLDTSTTYATRGSCHCYLAVSSPLRVNVSVESGPDTCHGQLNLTPLNYTVTCGQAPPPLLSMINETVDITWTKGEALKSTDLCVSIEKTNSSDGNLTLTCQEGGELVQTTGNTSLIWMLTPQTTTIDPVDEEAAAATFESNLVVGILSGIVIFLFIIGLIVQCDERRIKKREAKIRELLEQRRTAKSQAEGRLYPPKRKEVVETKL